MRFFSFSSSSSLNSLELCSLRLLWISFGEFNACLVWYFFASLMIHKTSCCEFKRTKAKTILKSRERNRVPSEQWMTHPLKFVIWIWRFISAQTEKKIRKLEIASGSRLAQKERGEMRPRFIVIAALTCILFAQTKFQWKLTRRKLRSNEDSVECFKLYVIDTDSLSSRFWSSVRTCVYV